jgi:hypothetical protein
MKISNLQSPFQYLNWFFKAHIFRGSKKSLNYGGMNLEMEKIVNFNII